MGYYKLDAYEQKLNNKKYYAFYWVHSNQAWDFDMRIFYTLKSLLNYAQDFRAKFITLTKLDGTELKLKNNFILNNKGK